MRNYPGGKELKINFKELMNFGSFVCFLNFSFAFLINYFYDINKTIKSYQTYSHCKQHKNQMSEQYACKFDTK